MSIRRRWSGISPDGSRLVSSIRCSIEFALGGPCAAAEQLEAVVDVVLDLHPRAAQDPQAVEVADQGPVGILDGVGALEFCARPAGSRRRCGPAASSGWCREP